jgi:hypothetical protein
LACAVMDWVNQNQKLRSGTPSVISAKDFLTELNTIMQGTPKDLRYWPGCEGSLSHRLLRLAPVLRSQGIEIQKLARTSAVRSRWEIKHASPYGLMGPRLVEQDAA